MLAIYKQVVYNTKVNAINWLLQYDPLAQLVEHMTFNHGVPSSNLGWVTK